MGRAKNREPFPYTRQIPSANTSRPAWERQSAADICPTIAGRAPRYRPDLGATGTPEKCPASTRAARRFLRAGGAAMSPLLRTWAHALGGVVAGGRQVLCPGPGHSPGDRSLSVTPDPHDRDGFVVHSHAGDDWRACRDHVRDRLGLPSNHPQPRPTRVVRPAQAPSDDRTARARSLWEEARDPYGTLVETYLASPPAPARRRRG